MSPPSEKQASREIRVQGDAEWIVTLTVYEFDGAVRVAPTIADPATDYRSKPSHLVARGAMSSGDHRLIMDAAIAELEPPTVRGVIRELRRSP